MRPCNVILVPRWGGHAESDWYPHVTNRLHSIATVTTLDMPSRSTPEPNAWLAALAAAMGNAMTSAEAHRGGEPALVGVGHSVGCQTWLRYLSEPSVRSMPRLAGLLFVAGWWQIDEPWPTLLPWLDHRAFDTSRVMARIAGPIHVVIGANDPYTRDAEANRQEWHARVPAARITIVEEGKHFNALEEPHVEVALREMIAAGESIE